MYIETRDRNRESWKFTYKGSELQNFAGAKVSYFKNREAEYRQNLANLLNNKSIALNSGKIDKVKGILQSSASMKECCEVFLHEFNRTPDREFSLSMADIVFFGIAGHSIAVDDEE